MKCEQCMPQLLPFVYDLLEAEERAGVAAHLEQCPSCQEALKAAGEQADLLAEAVKDHASGLVFKAPAEASASAPTVAMPRPRRAMALVNRWSIAAGLLMAFFSVGSILGWNIWRENVTQLDQAHDRLAKAKQDLAKSQQDLGQHKTQTQEEIRAIQQQINQLFSDWRTDENKKRKTEQDRVQISVSGPAIAQAGAPNNYQVQMFQKDAGAATNTVQAPGMAFKGQQPLPGMANQKLLVRAYDQKTQKTIFEQKLVTQQDGKANFILPSDIPFKPGDDIVLVFETHSPDGKLVKLGDGLKLVFPEYVTHLTTDRPMYRPGETVRFRSLTLERFSLKPAQQPLHLRYRIVGANNIEIFKEDVATQRLTDRKKESIRAPGGEPLHGVGVGEFTLPADVPGGQYTLHVTEVNDRFHEEKRTFLVHQWQAPRLHKDVKFHRTSYGAGDLVRVQLNAVPVAGVAPAGMRSNVQVTAKVLVDGQDVPVPNPENNFTDENGIIAFTFTLPPQIHKGIGSVVFTCDVGGIKETIRRSIPLAVNQVELDFYPEGGDLIAGVPNRVYFQARTPANRSADVEATLFDEKRQVVARIKTVTDDSEPGINQGMGSFTFTPRAKARYTARIDAPIGIDRDYPLPVKEKGLVMTIPKGIVADEIAVTLHSAKQPRDLLVGAYCRGRMLDHKFVKAAADGPTDVTLKPQGNVGGVYRVTVFEKLAVAGNLVYRPLAERLIFRTSSAKLEVQVEASQKTYQPGESCVLSLRAVNEKKVFVPAFAMVAVVDQSVLKLADEKTARTMPTHFLLTTEVRNPEDLENADVLLGTHPRAAQALDLLLGCQGWRRFAEQDPETFQRRLQQAKVPAFVANTNPVAHSLDAELKQMEEVDQHYVAKAIDLEKTLAEKEQRETELVQKQQQAPGAATAVQAAEQARALAEDRLRELRTFYVQFVMGGALLTLLLIGFFLISVGLRRLAEGEPARSWLLIGVALLGFLFCASVVGTFVFMGENLAEQGRRAPEAAPVFVDPVKAAGFDGPPLPAGPDDMRDEPIEADAEPKKDVPKAGAMMKMGQPAPQVFVNNDNPMFNPRQELVGNDARRFDFLNNPDERELRRQGKYQAILQNQLGRRVQLPVVEEACIVREFAHRRKPTKDTTRRDFAETIYWHPILVMPDGKAEVKFDLSDAVTRFQVLVYSHTADGRLGANQFELTSKLPFSFDPKTPIEVTNTDKITIPVAISNQRSQPTEATLSVRGKGLTFEGTDDRRVALDAKKNVRELFKVEPDIRRVALDAKKNVRELFKVEPDIVEGTAVLRVLGRTKNGSDAVERRFKIVQEGFPATGSISGVLENGAAEQTIILPDAWLPGSLQMQANFYPSPLAELQGGLEAMLREPIGCFEQASSSIYPNVLILNYMKAAGQINANFQPNPFLEKRSRQLLKAGYQQLIGFECTDPQQPGVKRGYEWFGGTAPPDVALTACALMQFCDMAAIDPVDESMLRRTEKYLLDQRDLKGGFQRNPRGLARPGQAPESVANAYIVWALGECRTAANLDAELAAIRVACRDSKDPYLLALAALAHLNRGKTLEGVELLRGLAALQKPDGELAGATASITGSQGHDLLVESTSLAILSWLKAERGEFTPKVNLAVKWLGQQRRSDGGFGATQATVLALKAVFAHAVRSPRSVQSGEVTLVVRDMRGAGAQPAVKFGPRNMGFAVPPGGLPEANRAFFSPHTHDPIVLNLRDPSALAPGKNVIQLAATQGQGQLPYTLSWSCRTRKLADDPAAPLKLKTSLSKENASEGEVVKLNAVLHNVAGRAQGMAVAVIGLPAGLSVPDDFAQLKAYAQPRDGGANAGKISAWELRGRDLVLYWRELAPAAQIEIDVDLICRLPGSFRGPTSRAYLYYDADRKHWVDPLAIQIDPAP